ncbi:MAG TPA: hypothetical protein VJU61_10825 [Polyangiaceae bacterium]|nr:hypothetical protein [Polyangiaceae bacterium]
MSTPRWKWTKVAAIHYLYGIGMRRHAKLIGRFHSKRGTDQGWDGYARKLGLGWRLWGQFE